MMMRRITLLFTAVCAALAIPLQRANAQSPCATSKVAFIQSAVILNSMPEYVKAESLLAQQYNAYKLELQQAGAAFDSARSAYQDKSALLSATAKAAEIKKLQDQDQRIQARTAELDQKMTAQRQQLLQPAETRAQDVIDGMRAEYNCSFIFDASAQAGIASADKSLDLTQRVLDRLKGSNAATTPPTTTTTPPAQRPTGIKPPTPSTPRKP